MRTSKFAPAMLAATAWTASNKTCKVQQPSPPKLAHLLTVFATEIPPIIVGNGGYGTRIFVPITGGSFLGSELQGSENYRWLNSAIGIGSIQVGDNNITVNLFRASRYRENDSWASQLLALTANVL
ncbi:hypothetical protein F4680DRAFT_448697 [Xylaria scruposa]|nr:hypothetical protein F4680DRAFT_448697 [Xylaria scruposa]